MAEHNFLNASPKRVAANVNVVAFNHPWRTPAAALVLLSCVLPGCGGPNQQAGSEQDKAAAAARGEPYNGSGPNERIGQAQDRAAAADQKVRDAEAKALNARGESLERQANIDATRLDEKSRSIREAADRSARGLDEQAKAVRYPAADSTKPNAK
jgi:hypothetical protein